VRGRSEGEHFSVLGVTVREKEGKCNNYYHWVFLNKASIYFPLSHVTSARASYLTVWGNMPTLFRVYALLLSVCLLCINKDYSFLENSVMLEFSSL
jgi:hypothetical protein